MAVNLGDDADTTGAIYGVEGIPSLWRDRIVKKDIILEIAGKLNS